MTILSSKALCANCGHTKRVHGSKGCIASAIGNATIGNIIVCPCQKFQPQKRKEEYYPFQLVKKKDGTVEFMNTSKAAEVTKGASSSEVALKAAEECESICKITEVPANRIMHFAQIISRHPQSERDEVRRVLEKLEELLIKSRNTQYVSACNPLWQEQRSEVLTEIKNLQERLK